MSIKYVLTNQHKHTIDSRCINNCDDGSSFNIQKKKAFSGNYSHTVANIKEGIEDESISVDSDYVYNFARSCKLFGSS